MAGEKSNVSLQLLGGDLCLDFANTVGDHKSDEPSEHLASYADLVAWSQHASALTNRAAQQMLDDGAQRPAAANNVFQRALVLREAIYRIFTAIAEGKSPKPADLDLVNGALANGLVHSRIISTKAGFRWDWTDENPLDRMMWLIARSAADLLTSGNLARVRQCGDDKCGWLFLDTTKNRSRRWCDMNDCGNRAKARRYYKRMRSMK
jgi:predicted RNA-binding Zn ribbon-like protein